MFSCLSDLVFFLSYCYTKLMGSWKSTLWDQSLYRCHGNKRPKHHFVGHQSWQQVAWWWLLLIKFDFQVKGLLDYRATTLRYQNVPMSAWNSCRFQTRIRFTGEYAKAWIWILLSICREVIGDRYFKEITSNSIQNTLIIQLSFNFPFVGRSNYRTNLYERKGFISLIPVKSRTVAFFD